jgi:hypothetical protein
MADSLYSIAHDVHPGLRAVRVCPFDLVARADLAIDGCTRLTNPERNGQPYTYAELHTEPPVALHAPWDYADVAGRLLEALTLARIMTGTKPDERDNAYAQLLYSCQREDGLIALPADPWTHQKPVVEMEWSPRGALLAWTTRYLALDDFEAIEPAQRLVHGLSHAAIWEGDTCWFPASFMPEGGWKERTPPTGKMTDVLIGAQIVFPLARFAGVTGSEEALHLAHGLIRFLRERSGAFTPDGKMTELGGHYFHSTTGFILGVLKYATLTGREDLLDWSVSAFHHARQIGTEFGFFPHGVSGDNRWQGDICATTDMIEIAILLGLHKNPDYFTFAERFGRNQLLENQIVDLDWVEKRVDAPFCPEVWCANHPPEGVTIEDICGRAMGGFTGWSRVNDSFDPANPRLMQRCTGAGTRGLYDLWHYAAGRPEGAVRVNLHFSRDTRWATVTSRIPQEGGVEVMMKTRGVLAVRVPYGLTNAQVEVLVNHQRPRHETLRGGYAWLEALQPGDTVMIKWPLAERDLVYEVAGLKMTGRWIGDTLLQVDPAGHLSPLYCRMQDVPPAQAHGATGPVKEIDSL